MDLTLQPIPTEPLAPAADAPRGERRAIAEERFPCGTEVSIFEHGHLLVVRLPEIRDFHHGDQVQATLHLLTEYAPPDADWRVDLSRLHHLPSLLLGCLLGINQTLRGRGRKLALVNVDPGLLPPGQMERLAAQLRTERP